MILAFIVLFAFIVVYKNKIGPNPEYLTHKQTTAINGLFVILVFLSHSKGYLKLEGISGRLYELFFASIGQLLVVMFFFYSGYGLMEQYSQKKASYLNGYLKKRVLRIWLYFVIAVILYIILNTMLSIVYPVEKIALSFIAWESIGNSNWYIFDILVFYLLFYLAMRMGAKHKREQRWTVILMWIFSLIFWIILSVVKDRYWYDTLLAFPMGMTYSCYKPKIEKKVADTKVWLFSLFCLILAFSIFYLIVRGPLGISLSSILFSLIVVFLTMKVRIYNDVLLFFGTHVFTIYVFQRIPMIFLEHFSMLQPMLFTMISLVMTLVFAIAFDRVYKKVDKIILRC